MNAKIVTLMAATAMLATPALAQTGAGSVGAAGAASAGSNMSSYRTHEGAAGTAQNNANPSGANANGAATAAGTDTAANENVGNNTEGANDGAANDRIQYLSSMPGLWRANKLDGLPVYNDSDHKIGSVANILVDQNGSVKAVVISSGGGLFGGGHDVAVPFDSLRWEVTKPPSGNGGGAGGAAGAGATAGGGANGNGNHVPQWALLPGATQASLKAAPEFKVNSNGG